jgi:peptidoglycan/LPS O-acetylase OafA/YrhL
MPQLDALRAFAVLAVLAFHYVPGVSASLQLGPIGVRLFFVLSGFLITGILLDCRRAVDDGHVSPWLALRSFYARRFLRIFPLFYFVLIATALLDIPRVRETFFWHASFLSNLYFSLTGEWAGPTSHFWSLAVEEQFYLFWPWVILFTPRRRLLRVVLCVIVAAPVFRLLGTLYGPNLIAPFILPFGCLDTLGAGALLAILSDAPVGFAVWRQRMTRAGLWVGGPLMAAVLVADYYGRMGLFVAVAIDIATALLSVWLIARAAEGFGGRAGRALEFKPLLHIGMVSYGLYVYHNFMPYLVPYELLRLVPYIYGLGPALLWTICAVTIASFSWAAFESPLNSFKRYFPYSGKTAPMRVKATVPSQTSDATV